MFPLQKGKRPGLMAGVPQCPRVGVLGQPSDTGNCTGIMRQPLAADKGGPRVETRDCKAKGTSRPPYPQSPWVLGKSSAAPRNVFFGKRLGMGNPPPEPQTRRNRHESHGGGATMPAEPPRVHAS